MSAPGRVDSRRGRTGEQLACDYLVKLGFTVLERNYRRRGGEIDIVAREGGTTVFVEVKERSGGSHGAGHDAVTAAKRRRIVATARVYASARGLSEAPLRFDVVSIEWNAGRPGLRHDRDAFPAEE